MGLSCVQKDANNYPTKHIQPIASSIGLLDTTEANLFKSIKENFRFLTCVYSDKYFLLIELKAKVYVLLIDTTPKLTLVNEFNKAENDRYFESKNKIIKVNTSSKTVFEITLTKDFKFVVDDSFHLNPPDQNRRVYFINPNSSRLLKENNSYSLLVNYGIYDKKNINFLDSTCLLKTTDRGNVYFGRHSRHYLKKYLADRETYFVEDIDRNIFLVGALSTQVYKCSNNRTQQQLFQIPNSQEANTYKESDLTNLAYTRKYLSENEKNIAIDILESTYLIILRKLAQKSITEKVRYQLTSFNFLTTEINSYLIADDLFPNYIPVSNKLIFISTDFKKLIQYELR